MSENFDVIIVGGGIAGASLGAQIAARRRTLIVEAEDQCGAHSTGRSAAFYLESYGGPQVARLTVASGPFLARPPADFAEHGFLRRRGALHLAQGRWPVLPDGLDCRRVGRAELDATVPGLDPRWDRALVEPGCADIDVAALHAAYLRHFRRSGGTIATAARLVAARRSGDRWALDLADGRRLEAAIIVNAAGAWADPVAVACGVAPLGLAPMRRTMVQLTVGRRGLADLPLILDSAGSFYFKGEGDSSLWLSPHDEIPSPPCDAAPEEIDVATAIDRFSNAVDWPIERIDRRWAGLRTFSPDRLPVYGFDPRAPGFFWCAGQGGFGIQTAPAAALLAAALVLAEPADSSIAAIDPEAFSPARFA